VAAAQLGGRGVFCELLATTPAHRSVNQTRPTESDYAFKVLTGKNAPT
jgi:hypothetical protein